MKHYEVELRRTSYMTITVEAENVEAAIEAAWKDLERNTPNIEDANWDIESVDGEAQ